MPGWLRVSASRRPRGPPTRWRSGPTERGVARRQSILRPRLAAYRPVGVAAGARGSDAWGVGRADLPRCPRASTSSTTATAVRCRTLPLPRGQGRRAHRRVGAGPARAARGRARGRWTPRTTGATAMTQLVASVQPSASRSSAATAPSSCGAGRPAVLGALDRRPRRHRARAARPDGDRPQGRTSLDTWQPSKEGHLLAYQLSGRHRGVGPARHGRRDRRGRRRSHRPRALLPSRVAAGCCGVLRTPVRPVARAGDEVQFTAASTCTASAPTRAPTSRSSGPAGRSRRTSASGLDGRPVAAAVEPGGHRAAQRPVARRPHAPRRWSRRVPRRAGRRRRNTGAHLSFRATDACWCTPTATPAPRARARPRRPRLRELDRARARGRRGGARGLRVPRRSRARGARARRLVDAPRRRRASLHDADDRRAHRRAPAPGRRHLGGLRRAPRRRPGRLVRLPTSRPRCTSTPTTRAPARSRSTRRRPARSGARDPLADGEYTSKDGTVVRMFVLSKDAEPDRPRPTILYGYGGFGISMTPGLLSSMLAWVEAGGVYAIAACAAAARRARVAPRRDARLEAERLRRLHAAAEWLEREGWTTRDQLASTAAATAACSSAPRHAAPGPLRRRHVHRAAARHGALRRVRARTVLDRRVRRPEVPEELDWLLGYSPYHNAREGRGLPATLFVVFDNDTRTDPMHGRKLCAAVQRDAGTRRCSSAPTETTSATGAKPRSPWRSRPDMLAFAARWTGLTLNRSGACLRDRSARKRGARGRRRHPGTRWCSPGWRRTCSPSS